MSRPRLTKDTKWGLMGGAFDPVHNAHLVLAERARESFELDGILFVPSHIPPHRENSPEASFEDRLEMVQLAISGNEYFAVSDLEREIDGPGYTVTVVEKLREKYPEVSWYLVLGADNLAIFDKWYKPEKVLELAKIVAGRRPGFEKELEQSPWSDQIHSFDMPLLEQSATGIRKMLKVGKSVRYLIPEEVRRYIINKELYR